MSYLADVVMWPVFMVGGFAIAAVFLLIALSLWLVLLVAKRRKSLPKDAENREESGNGAAISEEAGDRADQNGADSPTRTEEGGRVGTEGDTADSGEEKRRTQCGSEKRFSESDYETSERDR